MGCNIYTRALDPKIKTPEKVRAWYADTVSQSQYEDGHSYSGEIGCTSRIYFTGQVVDLIEDLDAHMDNVSKGDVAVFQVKVINENMATLVRWREEVGRLYNLVQSSDRASRLYPESAKSHLAVKARATKDLARARKRYETLRRNAAGRSKKLRYAVIAACPS